MDPNDNLTRNLVWFCILFFYALVFFSFSVKSHLIISNFPHSLQPNVFGRMSVSLATICLKDQTDNNHYTDRLRQPNNFCYFFCFVHVSIESFRIHKILFTLSLFSPFFIKYFLLMEYFSFAHRISVLFCSCSRTKRFNAIQPLQVII